MVTGERDPVTGQHTTGHEWNGIKELDNRVPRVVLFFLAATTLFAIGYWILMPAWPLGVTYTRGLLGVDQRDTVQRSLQQATVDRAVWTDQFGSLSFGEIRARPDLMKIVDEAGQTLFGDNCAVCHGTDAQGGRGFPDLTAGAWLWGGSPEAIYETLRVGINSTHPDTRFGQMPAFGDGVLQRADISAIVSFIRSSADGIGDIAGVDAERVDEGGRLFTENCAACHGLEGRGNPEVGAPDLMDQSWIHGNDRQVLFETISKGRQGHMPQWAGRLSDIERRILALYVTGLSEGRQSTMVKP